MKKLCIERSRFLHNLIDRIVYCVCLKNPVHVPSLRAVSNSKFTFFVIRSNSFLTEIPFIYICTSHELRDFAAKPAKPVHETNHSLNP